jgi:pSer/pThr/pTyr-binding forkhead associated (FHA) protein
MEAAPGPSSPRRKGPALAPAGELVIQNSRLKGTRRSLGVPLTFLGRAPNCDLRLDTAGVGSLHCLIAHGPGGFVVRDLDSESGTFVNGERVSSAPLRNGDVVTVGPFQLRARLPRLPAAGPTASAPAQNSSEPPLPDKEALRIQVAAVVAQQVALGEDEARLQQRRETLEQQETQLATHLEEKRRRLVELHTEVQATRSALKRDKEAYEKHVEKVTGDLSLAERDMLERRQQADAERRRALALQRRLKERYSRQLRQERESLRERERQVADAAQQIEKESERLAQERAVLAQLGLRFNGDMEVRARQLQLEWDRFRQEERAWQGQRRQENAELESWAGDLEQREVELARGQQTLKHECDRWRSARLGVEKELAGLENRVRNQRRKVAEQQQEVVRLEANLRQLREAQGAPADPAAAVTPEPYGPFPLPPAPPAEAPSAEAEPSTALVATPAAAADWQQQVSVLETLAGELFDQRLQLAEQWQQLAQARGHWQKEHDTAAAELRFLAARLHEQGQAFLARERALDAGTVELKQRHEELLQLRQHMVGWHARLRSRELAWEAERDRLLAELRGREELAERHLSALVELRQRWAKRRRRELDLLQQERDAGEKVRLEYAALREERRRLSWELEEQRSEVAAKTLALEQFRQQCLKKTADATAAERRVERLRRRWLAENAEAVRNLKREREALQVEVARFEERFAELQRRAGEVDAARAELFDRQVGREHQQALLEAEQTRLRQELQNVQAQGRRTAQEAEDMRNEVERIARQLLEEPDAPALLEKAA